MNVTTLGSAGGTTMKRSTDGSSMKRFWHQHPRVLSLLACSVVAESVILISRVVHS